MKAARYYICRVCGVRVFIGVLHRHDTEERAA